MNIEIMKLRGGKIEVWVDGEKWADGYKNSRGPRGYFYEFSDINGHVVRMPKSKSEWRVWSDKIASRDAGISRYSDTQIEPFGKRLPKAIEKMIEAGELRSPTQCRADAAVRHAEYEARERRDAEAQAKLFDDKAEEVLAGIVFLNKNRDAVKRRIIGAMRWAQTQ